MSLPLRHQEAARMSETVKEVLHDIFVGTYPGPRFRIVRWGGDQQYAAVVSRLHQALMEVADGSLSRDWLSRLCRSLIRGQREAFGLTAAGSWAVCGSDGGMAMNARAAFIVRPTQIAIAILSLTLMKQSRIADAITDFRPALARGMAFCAGHALEGQPPGVDFDGRQILILGRVDDVLRLDSSLCPALADVLGLNAQLSDPAGTPLPHRNAQAGARVEISLSKMTGWEKVKRVVTHPDGDTFLIDEFDTATQRLVTASPDGTLKVEPVATGMDSITGSASIAPWGGHFIGFRSTYSHTARDGEQNFYETTCHLHTLPDGNHVFSHSLFVGSSTSHVDQIFWEQSTKRLILDCNFCLKIFSMDDGKEAEGAYAWSDDSYTDYNFRFSKICIRANCRQDEGGFQFVSNIYDGWRFRFSGIAVTEVPSGRQWFLDDQRWRPWPQGYEDRCERPPIRHEEAVYSADGQYVLVLGSDQILRSWTADDFRPCASRVIDLKGVKGMHALPGGQVVVWNEESLMIADCHDGSVAPTSWETSDRIRSVQLLPQYGLIAVHAWNYSEGGGPLYLLDQTSGAEVWKSPDHLGFATEVHPFRYGMVLKDKQENWWVAQCSSLIPIPTSRSKAEL